jgi:hypothetical protein
MAFDYKSWYQENKESLLREKKRRYQTDKEYRRKLRMESHDYYHKYVKKPFLTDRQIVQDENGQKLYTIGRLASMLRRDIDTIRLYHRMAVIPEPSQFDTRGWRLYTPSQASLLQSTFLKFDRRELRNLREVRAEIAKKWRK